MLSGSFDENAGLAFRITGKPWVPPKNQRDTNKTLKKNHVFDIFAKF